MKIVLTDDEGTLIDSLENVSHEDLQREVDRHPTGLLSELNLGLAT